MPIGELQLCTNSLTRVQL